MILDDDIRRQRTRTLAFPVGCAILAIALAAARPSASVAPRLSGAPDSELTLPALHQLETVTLSPSYGCRSREETAKAYPACLVVPPEPRISSSIWESD